MRLSGKSAEDRGAYFVSVLAVARRGQILAVISNRADGTILESPRGTGGFGYDPVFYFPPLEKSFAELSSNEKNRYSHRGKAFRRLLQVFAGHAIVWRICQIQKEIKAQAIRNAELEAAPQENRQNRIIETAPILRIQRTQDAWPPSWPSSMKRTPTQFAN